MTPGLQITREPQIITICALAFLLGMGNGGGTLLDLNCDAAIMLAVFTFQLSTVDERLEVEQQRGTPYCQFEFGRGLQLRCKIW